MNLFIYSDESGVFDNAHNSYYVFGGILFLSSEEKNEAAHKFLHVENMIKDHYLLNNEVKGSNISRKNKYKLLKTLDNYIKFGTVIRLRMLDKNLFMDKKTKQRYLDWAYKMGIKNVLKKLEEKKVVKLDQIENIYIYNDEHTTSTNGIYELKESIEAEFKIGIYNYKYNTFYPPIMPNINSIELKYLDSKSSSYIRMADIISNYLYNLNLHNLKPITYIYLKKLPSLSPLKQLNPNQNELIYA